jgi:hypothetical protein
MTNEEELLTNAKETKIIFREAEYIKVKLKIKTEQDKINQTKFLRACVSAYINDDPKFMDWLDHYLEREKKLRPHEKRAREKQKLEVEDTIANFRLDDQEVDGFFDIMEKENPDL